jgi:hypothetical protein
MLTAQALYAAGVRYMFGVVGIPVTRLAPCAQQVSPLATNSQTLKRTLHP